MINQPATPRRVGLGYLLPLFGGLTCALAAFGLSLFGLERSGNLPPEQFVRRREAPAAT